MHMELERTQVAQQDFDRRTNGTYKWSERQIRQEFKDQDERIKPNFNKVRKFQVHTDDLTECVMWCINSIRNDREERRRALDHGTGAT